MGAQMGTHWIRSSTVVWEELDREAMLVLPSNGARCLLNTAAATLWKLCDGSRNMDQLTRAFVRASGRSMRQSRREVAEFCDRFCKLGFLLGRDRMSTAAVCPTTDYSVVFQSGLTVGPAFRSLSLGASGPRRRPSPRGNSGPG